MATNKSIATSVPRSMNPRRSESTSLDNFVNDDGTTLQDAYATFHAALVKHGIASLIVLTGEPIWEKLESEVVCCGSFSASQIPHVLETMLAAVTEPQTKIDVEYETTLNPKWLN